MDCEKIERLYADLQRVMGNEVLEDEFFEDIYRELTRVLGGMVPDWVKVNKDLLEVLKDHVGKFDRCEFVHIVLSPSHFHPCESGEILLKELRRFLSECDEVYFYPLENTLHISVLLSGKAVSFPSEGEQAGYAIQIAGMCGVKVEPREKGDCAVVSGDHEEIMKNFERVAVIGKIEMVRDDLEEVLKLLEDSLESIVLFFKPGGRYQRILREHPLLYDFVVETAASPGDLTGKAPLGEIAEVERIRKRKFVEGKAVVFDGCTAKIVEDEFVEKGSYLIKGWKLRVLKALLSTSLARNLLKRIPLEGFPIPLNISEEDAQKFEEKIRSIEKNFLGLQNTS